MQSFFNGITVWAYNVLPALFPFMVLTTLTLKNQPRRKRSFTRFLFGVKCDKVFLTSVLCGYPVGAKAIAECNADADTATSMCAFCSTASPIFITATLGAKLLQNTTATVIVVIAHILSAILNGLIFRVKKGRADVDNASNLSAVDIGDTLASSAMSIITVGGLIALFYMLTDMVKSLLPSNVSDSLIIAFVVGAVEMTNGVFGVCKLADVATATVLCSTLLSFGGLCVFAQCYAFLGAKHVKPLQLLKMKTTQSALATILSFILTQIFLQ